MYFSKIVTYRHTLRFVLLSGGLVLVAAHLGCIPVSIGQNPVATTPPSLSEMSTAAVSGAVSSFLMDVTLGGAGCPTPNTSLQNSSCAIDKSATKLTLIYNNCTVAGSGQWQGSSQVVSSGATVSCGTPPSALSGVSLTRTLSANTQLTTFNRGAINVDTSGSSGYQFSVSGGTQISFMGLGDRKLAIGGLHVTGTAMDYSISTSVLGAVDIGTNTGAKVVNGTVTTQDNSNKITGTAVLKNVTYSMISTCCHPQSGTVTTTLTGTKTGTEVLTFSSLGCGSAILKDTSGNSNPVGLTSCF
jgi:hypothetical protein